MFLHRYVLLNVLIKLDVHKTNQIAGVYSKPFPTPNSMGAGKLDTIS